MNLKQVKIRYHGIGLILVLAVYVLFLASCGKSSEAPTGNGGSTETPSQNQGSESQDEGSNSYVSELKEDAPPADWYADFQGWDTPLSLVYYDDTVAIFYDPDIPDVVEWPFEYTGRVWAYIRDLYEFGREKRLWAVYHGKYEEPAHPGTIFDSFTQGHSLINFPFIGFDQSDWNVDAPVHEMGHIVEFSAQEVNGSPAFGIWGDSKWAEIFIYDVFGGINETELQEKRFVDYNKEHDNFPVPNTYWFRDWFYPIYDQYGGSTLLNEFFILLSKYYPQSGIGMDRKYTRNMNLGEFIHFWSGAAEKDLRAQAETAFGWDAGFQLELNQARKEFPELQYEVEESNGGSQITDQTKLASASLSVSQENPGGAVSKEGSVNVLDGHHYTKFYTRPFPENGIWLQQSFAGPTEVNQYVIEAANDFAGRDPKSWRLEGSNDGENWDVLDSRTDEVFYIRFLSKTFHLESEVSYTHYRLTVTENNGATDFQLSGWKLLKTE